MATLAQLSVGIGGGTVIVPRKEKLEAAFGEPINRALGRIDSGLSAFRLQSKATEAGGNHGSTE
jgi:hypothetical protein